MDITGKFIQVLPKQEGTSARGSWSRQDFIIETEDQFPKKVCISNWNDKINLASINPGEKITLHFNLESREYNNKWYTDVRVWKMDTTNNAASSSDTPPFPPKSLLKPRVGEVMMIQGLTCHFDLFSWFFLENANWCVRPILKSALS